MFLGKKVTGAVGFHNGSLAAKRAEPSFRGIRGHSWADFFLSRSIFQFFIDRI